MKEENEGSKEKKEGKNKKSRKYGWRKEESMEGSCKEGEKKKLGNERKEEERRRMEDKNPITKGNKCCLKRNKSYL